MTVDYYQSPRAPIFAELVATGRGTADAVALVRRREAELKLGSPQIYVSTAITSAGWKRDPAKSIGEVIAANNRTAGLLMGRLVDAPGVIHNDNCMVPTELAKMTLPSGEAWGDSHYLTFYFAYAAGLSDRATRSLETSMASSVYAAITGPADDRKRSNDERSPFYFAFVDILLGKVLGLTRAQDGVDHEPFSVLMQLVDTTMSLGCTAERMYAEYFGLDVVVPAIARQQLAPDDPLGLDIEALEGLGASVGRVSSAVLPVAVTLNAAPTLPTTA